MFIFRVYHSLTGSMDERWSNTFEAIADGAGTLSDLTTLGDKLLALCQGMTGGHVSLPGYSISTWVPDSTPYNPENFYVSPTGEIVGSRFVAAPLALEVCELVQRKAVTGRTGRIYFRGGLGEADVEREGRFWKLTDPTARAAALAAIITLTDLAFYFAGGAAPLTLSMIGWSLGAIGPHWQMLTGLEIGGVTTNNMNHRWYNQPNRTAAALARKAAREAIA
jgi:hypothetical protein